jgi:hypothetical protein
MRMKPPRVPRAATVAFEASQGPRFLPGTYTVRLTKGTEKIETKLVIDLDRRAPYTMADRKAELDAALRARSLFDDMSALSDRIDVARAGSVARKAQLPAGDALGGKIDQLVQKLDDTKKKIVATKEGGAITGEERIREHLSQVYGALLGWEGRPARYQLERIDALTKELGDVKSDFDALVAGDVKAIDAELRSKSLDAIPTDAHAAQALLDGEGESEPEVVTAAMRCLSTGGHCEEAKREAAAAARTRD